MASPWGRLEEEATGVRKSPPRLGKGRSGHWAYAFPTDVAGSHRLSGVEFLSALCYLCACSHSGMSTVHGPKWTVAHGTPLSMGLSRQQD